MGTNMASLGGPLWLVIDVVAVLILAGALIYGTRMYRKRRKDPAAKAAQDRATDDLFNKRQGR